MTSRYWLLTNAPPLFITGTVNQQNHFVRARIVIKNVNTSVFCRQCSHRSRPIKTREQCIEIQCGHTEEIQCGHTEYIQERVQMRCRIEAKQLPQHRLRQPSFLILLCLCCPSVDLRPHLLSTKPTVGQCYFTTSLPMHANVQNLDSV